jgi:hypothetical protein
VSITYEEIGLFPRSFSRVLDRFLKQLFSDVDNLVIQEYRFYRYLFLTTIKTIFILFFVPFVVNFAAKNYVVKPVTEYFWNTQHPEIFLNSYEQKRAFAELEKFEEKIYFEALVQYNNYRFEIEGHTKQRSINNSGSGIPTLPLSTSHTVPPALPYAYPFPLPHFSTPGLPRSGMGRTGGLLLTPCTYTLSHLLVTPYLHVHLILTHYPLTHLRWVRSSPPLPAKQPLTPNPYTRCVLGKVYRGCFAGKGGKKVGKCVRKGVSCVLV